MQSNSLGVLLPEMRLDFWDELWHGQISNASALDRRLSVLELPLRADAPCCRCVLRLQHGDAYLNHIWRYGRDRLRVAVGNLLPREERGVVYGVCRLTPRHVYILACAMAQTDADTLLARAKEDIARLVEALENYLDLHSELKEIVPVSSIRELAETAS
ncbi:MAG: hypothetical protein UFE80_08220 [Christensenellales bacterium]|uniref:Uncharacterized protein n=1 Tax=Candidatus Avichristensenella intestinipullorum TaxID=2840693 RepID=A0A9D0YUT2_9FIRM|nr:hypothetical protein [Christensenellales bacterium]HIQ62507.1 hypothetical protein [Candidatus Avichristensenella intestinipullorum]